ncbi:MAG: hypothetical protein KA792_08485 [Bacteroidales bacterium]|nr:hypothetical protein [Bacteroidales bacterium]
MNRFFLLIIILVLSINSFSQDTTKLKYKLIFSNKDTLIGTTNNRTIYLLTDFAKLKFLLSEIDTVEFGIMPLFHKEKKINNLLFEFENNKLSYKFVFNKISGFGVRVLPIVKSYFTNNNYQNKTLQNDSLMTELLNKYDIAKDFNDKDILSIYKQFKVAGYFSFNKNRILIKFKNTKINRNNLKKIIILHN